MPAAISIPNAILEMYFCYLRSVSLVRWAALFFNIIKVLHLTQSFLVSQNKLALWDVNENIDENWSLLKKPKINEDEFNGVKCGTLVIN